ncbi:MAG TPA: helix-turn-helix domain-containing protein [Phytomonospora sp.]
MAIPFTADERERIHALLLDAGEALFPAQGLKKTSLDELVAPAGVAKGSFYAFFDSKEALYAAVMLRRAPLVAERLRPALARRADVAGVTALLRDLTDVLTTDPFYRRLLTHPEELRAVARRVAPADVERIGPQLIAPVLDYIERGQRDGLLVGDVEPATVLGVMRTVGLVVMNRELFGADHAAVLDATIAALARGLTDPERS